tara:strand:- start:224 stop:574 length:351 start_codon:yes stop_codon:yes gene_type:complete
MNGYQYIDNDLHCMICDTPDQCSNCSEERILPWTQDIDDDNNDGVWDDENEDGMPDELYGDVWDDWDITLRDLIFLNKQGEYVTRINLTGYNPEPTALGECTDNYTTIKNLILNLR